MIFGWIPARGRFEKTSQIDASKGRKGGETNLDPPESPLNVSVNEIEVFFDVDWRDRFL